MCDAAVLKAIKDAGLNGIGFMDLRPLVPKFDGQTDEQHRAAISNALTRARIKGHAKLIDATGRWVMN